MQDIFMRFIITIIAILPIIIICKYINSKDKNKEPLILLVSCFIAGILSAFLTLFLSDLLCYFFPILKVSMENLDLIHMFLYATLMVGLIEEFSKWIMIRIVGYENYEYDEIYDMIVYAVFVSLGFACLENIIYAVSEANVVEGIKVALVRALSAVPAHACNAVFMGYYLTLAKIYQRNKNIKKENLYKLKSIVVPSLLHGIYDFCISSNYLIFLILFIVFIIWLYIETLDKIDVISKQNAKIKIKDNNKYCKKCGAVMKDDYCAFCGSNDNYEKNKIYRMQEHEII